MSFNLIPLLIRMATFCEIRSCLFFFILSKSCVNVIRLFYSVAQMVKNLPAMQETQVRSLGLEDLLEKGMATHSSILAWRIPGTIESMGSQRVGHN